MSEVPLAGYLLLALLMFSFGTYGVLVRVNIMERLAFLQLMFAAVHINFLAFYYFSGRETVSGGAIVLLLLVIFAVQSIMSLGLLYWSLFLKKRKIN